MFIAEFAGESWFRLIDPPQSALGPPRDASEAGHRFWVREQDTKLGLTCCSATRPIGGDSGLRSGPSCTLDVQHIGRFLVCDSPRQLTVLCRNETVQAVKGYSVPSDSGESKARAMSRTAINHPDKAANTGSYSAGLVCDGWLYVSGHASQNLKTGHVIAGTTAEETTRTLESISKVLKEAGCTFADVVKCTCYLSRIEDFAEFDAAYAQFFRQTVPARTTVQAVLWGGLKIEIDAIARIPAKRS
jgi:2-iminobutanoate/2-iminopropanoate deaminase